MKQKGLRKLVSIVLAVVMVLGLTCTAFAADITIKNTNEGETYKVYQIFTATVDGDAITYYITSDSAYYGSISQDEDSPFNLVQVGTTTTYQVTWTAEDDEVLAYLVSLGGKGSAVATATGNGSEITIDDLAAGYYFVTTTTGTAVSVGTTGSAVIADKNSEPTVEKEETTDGTAGIGDKVEYKVTITAAEDVTTLVYHDTMSSGLTFNNDVKIEDMNEGKDADYTVSNDTSDGCTFEITFTDSGLAKITSADQSVVITYSATVNEDAVIDGSGNTNTGSLSYGDAGKSQVSTTTTKVYDLTLKKVNSNDKELSGATFILKNADNKEITVTKDENGDYRVSSDGTDTITVGSATIYGLDAGTYTLTETAAPAGYNLLTSAVEVTINKDGTVTFGSEPDVTTVKVVNQAGSSLPATGGMGTTIFYIVGGVLVLGAAVLFVTKKRLGGEN